jgi:hypothetical protein
MRKKTSNQVQIASFSDSSCIKRRSKICKSGTEEYSFPHRAQSEERNTGGGGSSSSRNLGFRISAMAGGRRARRKRRGTRSLTVRARRRDDDEKFNSRPLRTRRSRPSSSTSDENSPPRLHLLLPTDDEKPQFRPSVTTKLRPFVYLRGGLLIRPPPPLFRFQLFQSRGLFLISFFLIPNLAILPPKV